MASFSHFAQFDNQIIIIDSGMGETAKRALANHHIVPLKENFLYTVAELSQQDPGIYAFWDCSCYFQDSIMPIFDLAESHLVCC